MLKLNKLKMGMLIVALVFSGNAALAFQSDRCGDKSNSDQVQADNSVNGNS